MSDALERLKKRNRPVVPNRDASLTSPNIDTSIPRNLDTLIPCTTETSISRIQELELSRPKETTSSSDLIQGIQIPTNTETSNSEAFKTKQSTMRLEQGMCDRLQDICREYSLSREVLIEAMFEYCEGNSEAMQAVLANAQIKSEQRLQIANLKRAQSMMKRFGQPG